ncbi:MAG: Gfo/Idh/MocA family oxidoreductase [Burkholderiaceae bacterium]|nr:Gfo/Idh/MocA family oxidoreductase [Burkholderiaceae bacterium]MDO9088613.1 Gfo/Idh/MocA family oxidoreductase [Burkholderiaceae bacterium]
MPQKIRVGVIGANAHLGWAQRSHLPALAASPDCELAAVCTTRPESAEESRLKYGAGLAFHDYREMVASPAIDLVAVVVRVPNHFEPTKAALEAGKHVYTEWPLGRTTAEAVELAALARTKGLRTVVGLQARVNPGLVYMKELIANGYVGEVLACHVSMLREGQLQRPSSRMWQRDPTQGVHTLTIAAAHTLDALRFVTTGYSQLTSLVTTLVRQWLDTDTGEMVDVSAPDNVQVNARLSNGAVVCAQIASVPWAASGYRMEIYGREGTLVATSDESPQLAEVQLQGARSGHRLQPMDIPSRLVLVPDNMPRGSPFVVGQMYHQVAQALHTGHDSHPTFETAVELHRIVDAIRLSSDSGREVAIQ